MKRIKGLKSLKDDNGSAVVEAVIVLPIVILALMSAIVIVSYISGRVFVAVDAHKYLRDEAGRETETRAAYEIEEEGKVSDGYHNGRKIKRTDFTTERQKSFLIKNRMKKDKNARVYVIDEKKTTRYMDFLEEIVY